MNEKVITNLDRLKVMALEIESEIKCMLEDIEEAREAENLDDFMGNTFCIRAQIDRVERKARDMRDIVLRAEDLFDE